MTPKIYQFKITLLGIQPLIWRRFRVYNDITFRQLHNTVQITMGWENYHLFQFFWGDTRFTDSLVAAEDKTASNVSGEYITQERAILGYEYDFLLTRTDTNEHQSTKVQMFLTKYSSTVMFSKSN